MYHISPKFLGKTKIFYPRKMNDGTFNDACICVAPTIPQALLAMPIFNSRCLFVYKTLEGGDNSKTKQIYDYRFTHECRIYKRADFKHVITIDKFTSAWIKEIKNSISNLADITINFDKADYTVYRLGLKCITSILKENKYEVRYISRKSL